LIAYADTSFLVSLYVPDANSAAAARQMQGSSLPVLITPLSELELMNAVQLRLFRKEVRPIEARAANAAFRADLHEGVFAMRAARGHFRARAAVGGQMDGQARYPQHRHHSRRLRDRFKRGRF